MCVLLELLEGVGGDLLGRVLVLVNVVDLDLIFVTRHICHHEVLLNRRRKHRITAVVDVLTNDVHSPRRSAEVSGLHPVKLLESLSQVLEPRLVLPLDAPVRLVIRLGQLLEHRHERAIVRCLSTCTTAAVHFIE